LIFALPIAYRAKDGRSLTGLVFAAAFILALAYGGTSLVTINEGRWSANLASQDVGGRFAMARDLLGASTANPFTTIFGVGNSSSFQLIGYYPHIAGLEILAEEGIVGEIVYFAIIFLSFRSIKRILEQPDLSESRRNGLAILTGLFVFELVLSWKQGSLLGSIYVFAYAIILARLEEPETLDSLSSMQSGGASPVIPRFQNLLR